MKPILVFQSDFTYKEGAVCAMYGVVKSVDRELEIIDGTHELPQFDTWSASYRLYQVMSFWPKGTIFVSIVDPGVGTKRRASVAHTVDGYYVVSPDNGSLTHIKYGVGIREIREIDETTNRLKGKNTEGVSVFHGRDLFSYCAARLASGIITFEEVGPKYDVSEVIAHTMHEPVIEEGSAMGMIEINDPNFGNIWTNFPLDKFQQAGFNFDQSSYVNCRHQYECYAAAAEEMWTGGATDLSTFDYSEIFARQMGENRLSDNSYGGFYCPLYTPSTDYLPSLVKVLPSNWKTLGDWVGRVYSPLPADSGAEPGVVMSAVFHPESAGGQVGYSKLTVPIGLTADTVLFTGTTTIPAADNLQIATVTVQYVDKTTHQIPIRVGVETANYSCPTGTLDRQVSPSGGNDADGNPILYHSYIWTNPYPSKPIMKMEITTSYTTSGWYLRDITGLRAGAVPVGMTEWVLE